MPVASKIVTTPDDICWYTEMFYSEVGRDLENDPGYIVLIPSGEGDCHSMSSIAHLLSTNTNDHVLTFDMPGFSRTTASPSAYAHVTPQLLAQQIITLLDTLDITQPVTFFGCSSGGCATLTLAALYPSRVKCGIIHEVPLSQTETLLRMREMTDSEINAMCEGLYAKGLIEQNVNDGARKWEDLGPAYHARLAKNYVTWVRGYVDAIEIGTIEIVSVPENLRRRPLFWTVGSLNEGAKEGKGIWEPNFVAARNAGLEIETERLNCLHFPTVTVPDDLAKWIHECIVSVEDKTV